MDSKVVPEMIRIMGENISHWRSFILDEILLFLVWRLVYTPEVLSNKQYHDGFQLLDRIYGSASFVKKQKMIIFLKRILGKLKSILQKGQYGK
jgi:hypothetical protein